MAYLGGIHFWWPKMTGRRYPEKWGQFSAVTIFFGFNMTFFPQFILGYLGMPRRYYEYPPDTSLHILNLLSSVGVVVLAVGYLVPLFYLLWSLCRGEVAGNNPWNATGLEWKTASPPTKHNFEKIPTVTEGPYAYSPEKN